MRPSAWLVSAVAFVAVLSAAAAHAQSAVCPGPASRDPAWSPDGSRIAFSSTREGASSIWSIVVATGDLQRLTAGEENGYYPRFSPDGKRIAFTSMSDAGQRVAIVDAGGGPTSTITNPEDNAADPDWISNTRLIYSSEKGGTRDLWTADVDGGNSSLLFHMDGEEWAPRIAPSRQRLLFHNDGAGSYDVYTARFDGSELQLVAQTPGFDGVASWSPDGTTVAYYTRAAAADGSGPAWETAEIMVVPATGGAPRPLTSNRIRDQSPAWSPDGKAIAWASCASGNLDIWLMDADGGHARQLTRTQSTHQ